MRLTTRPTNNTPCILVLGMFDGVHMGHISLIKEALAIKRETGLPVTVATFDRHPLTVLKPEKAPPMLTTLLERARAMARLAVDTLCVLPFHKSTAGIDHQDFLDWMIKSFHPRHIVVGFNYSFGKGGLGSGDFLREQAQRYGYATHIVPPVVWEGETVSSTRIRELLERGELMTANTLLTRAYGMTGVVAHGKKLGRTMGFPTANVTMPPHKAVPCYGVYTALLREGNKVYPSVLSIGCHPTLPEGDVTLEVHVLGGSIDLYGKKVRISFLDFLRPELKFDGVDELIAQMKEDALKAEAFFNRDI